MTVYNVIIEDNTGSNELFINTYSTEEKALKAIEDYLLEYYDEGSKEIIDIMQEVCTDYCFEDEYNVINIQRKKVDSNILTSV